MAISYVPPSFDRTNEGRTPLHASLIERVCSNMQSEKSILQCHRGRHSACICSLEIQNRRLNVELERFFFFLELKLLPRRVRSGGKASRVCPLRKGRLRKHLQILLLLCHHWLCAPVTAWQPQLPGESGGRCKNSDSLCRRAHRDTALPSRHLHAR